MSYKEILKETEEVEVKCQVSLKPPVPQFRNGTARQLVKIIVLQDDPTERMSGFTNMEPSKDNFISEELSEDTHMLPSLGCGCVDVGETGAVCQFLYLANPVQFHHVQDYLCVDPKYLQTYFRDPYK